MKRDSIQAETHGPLHRMVDCSVNFCTEQGFPLFGFFQFYDSSENL